MTRLIAMSKARDIMQKNVITIELEKTAQYALTILKDRDISFLVVENSKPVGIVSERDIVRKIVAENKESIKNTTRINNVKKNQVGTTKFIHRISSSKNVKQQLDD